MRGNSHRGLTGTGRGCQHHVMSGGNAQNGLVLGGVQGHAAGRNPLGKRLIDFFGGEGVALKIASIVVAGILTQRGRKKIQNTHEDSSLSGITRARGRYRYEGTGGYSRSVCGVFAASLQGWFAVPSRGVYRAFGRRGAALTREFPKFV